MALCVWLLSLSIMFSRLIQAVVWFCTSLPFFWLNNIPLYVYMTFCLSIHQLIDIWVVSRCFCLLCLCLLCLGCFCLLWVMLLWLFLYNFLGGHMFSVLLGIYLGVGLLGHMVTLCLTFWGAVRMSSKEAAPFYFPANNVWVFQFLHVFGNTYYYLLDHLLS